MRIDVAEYDDLALLYVNGLYHGREEWGWNPFTDTAKGALETLGVQLKYHTIPVEKLTDEQYDMLCEGLPPALFTEFEKEYL